ASTWAGRGLPPPAPPPFRWRSCVARSSSVTLPNVRASPGLTCTHLTCCALKGRRHCSQSSRGRQTWQSRYMTLIAGVDSSTQSCKVVICDAETGQVVRSGRASHPAGTEVDPNAWWDALQEAIAAAGGIDDVEAISIGGQQHGCVVLDADGAVIRPALLWNDSRSAPDAERLIRERGDDGERWWAEAVGLVPVASFTVTKLAWIARNEPENAARIAAVCLPHDWLTWRLAGNGAGHADLTALTTDRSDASGTGYYDAESGTYHYEILDGILSHRPVLPRVLGPLESAGTTSSGAKIGP